MQCIALGEVHRRAVRRDVVADMLVEQTLRRVDHLAVIERERGHGDQLDPVALPIVLERALERPRLRVDLRDVAARELGQERH